MKEFWCFIIPAGIVGYLYVKGLIRMNWLFALLGNLLKNNGNGTDAGTVDVSDVWDALQVGLIAALAVGGEAALKSLETFSGTQTGVIAAVLGVVVFLGKALLNWASNNKPKG